MNNQTDDLGPPTQEIPPLDGGLLAEQPDLFYGGKHFKYLLKKTVRSIAITVGGVVVYALVMIFTPTSVAYVKLAATLLLGVLLVGCWWSIRRAYIYWRDWRLKITAAIITIEFPTSRLFNLNFKSPMIPTRKIDTAELEKRTLFELFFFRNCRTVTIDTAANEDEVFHDMTDMKDPELLKQVVEDLLIRIHGDY